MFDPALFPIPRRFRRRACQQGPKPGRSLGALQGRERHQLELLKPVEAPAVHAALEPIQAFLALALPHCLQKQEFGIRSGVRRR